MSRDDLNAKLADYGCPPVPAILFDALITPYDMALSAYKTVVVPAPTPGRYPFGHLKDGRPYTVVKAYTWFWTDSARWKPLSATARAGAVWATVTAMPVRLSFTPGDGNAAVSCGGPGSQWREGRNGPWDPSPSGCQYRYPHTSEHYPDEEVTATYTITWQVTWIGSGNTTGTFATAHTFTTTRFVVAELQTVVGQ